MDKVRQTWRNKNSIIDKPVLQRTFYWFVFFVIVKFKSFHERWIYSCCTRIPIHYLKISWNFKNRASQHQTPSFSICFCFNANARNWKCFSFIFVELLLFVILDFYGITTVDVKASPLANVRLFDETLSNRDVKNCWETIYRVRAGRILLSKLSITGLRFNGFMRAY